MKMKTKPVMLFALSAVAAALTLPALAQSPKEPQYQWTVGGHTGNPDYGYEEMTLSPDGKLLATAAPDGTVKIWDAKTTQLLRTISVDGTFAYCVAFSPDGTKIAAGGSTYVGSGGAALIGGSVNVYDTASGDHVASLPTTVWNITAVTFSPDGTQLVDAGYIHNASTGVDDGMIETYRIADQTLLKTMSSAERIGQLAYLPDHKTLLAAGYHYDFTANTSTPILQRWNPVTGTLLQDLPTKLTALTGLHFSPDNSVFAVCGGVAHVGTIEVWNSATLKLQSTLAGNLAYINEVAFDATGKNILGGGYKRVYKAKYDLYYHRGAVELWSVNGQRKYTSGMLNLTEINSVAFDPDGNSFVAAANDLGVNRYATQNASLQSAFTRFHYGVSTVAVCDVNDTLAVRDYYGTLSLYSATTGKPLGAPPRKTGFVRFVPNSANMVFLDSGSQQQIKIVPLDGSATKAVTSQLGFIVDVVFSPDGKLAAAIGISKTINGAQYKAVEIFRVSDWTRQQQINAFALTPQEVNRGLAAAVAFSPDDRALVIAVNALQPGGSVVSGNMATYDVPAGKALATANLSLLKPNDTSLSVVQVVFSQDSKRILLGMAAADYHTVEISGAVQTYDANLHLIRQLDTEEAVTTMKLSPSGQHLMFGGYAQDPNTGRHIGTLTAMNVSDGAIVLRYDDQVGTGVNAFDFRNVAGASLFVGRPDATFGAITMSGFGF